MRDLFEREQRILDEAIRLADSANEPGPGEYKALANEYGRVIKQLRRVTKLSDKTVVD